MKLKQVAIAFTFYFVAAGFKLPDFENATNLDIGLHIIYDKLHRDLTSLLLGENQYQNDMVRYLLQNSSDKMDVRFREFDSQFAHSRDKNDARFRVFDSQFADFRDKNDARFADFSDKNDAQFRVLNARLADFSDKNVE